MEIAFFFHAQLTLGASIEKRELYLKLYQT